MQNLRKTCVKYPAGHRKLLYFQRVYDSESVMEMSENKNVAVENGIAALRLFIEADECDMTASWRPSAAVTAMQRATHYSRKSLGIDWDSLAEQGALWVVSRVNVKLDRMPHMGEEIILRATPLTPVKALFPWKFEFLDSDNNPLGEGETLWNLMDASTRRLAIRPEITAKIPQSAQGVRSAALPAAARELEGIPKRHVLSPAYSDLDINGHASHLRYIDWCCNELGAAVIARYQLREFRISYLQEVRAGQRVDTELRIDGTSFSFSGYHGETPAFVIDGTLSDQ